MCVRTVPAFPSRLSTSQGAIDRTQGRQCMGAESTAKLESQLQVRNTKALLATALSCLSDVSCSFSLPLTVVDSLSNTVSRSAPFLPTYLVGTYLARCDHSISSEHLDSHH